MERRFRPRSSLKSPLLYGAASASGSAGASLIAAAGGMVAPRLRPSRYCAAATASTPAACPAFSHSSIAFSMPGRSSAATTFLAAESLALMSMLPSAAANTKPSTPSASCAARCRHGKTSFETLQPYSFLQYFAVSLNVTHHLCSQVVRQQAGQRRRGLQRLPVARLFGKELRHKAAQVLLAEGVALFQRHPADHRGPD